VRLIALPEGTYTVGLDKVFIPFNPKTDSIKDRPASLLVEIQPFLLNTTHDIILCDTVLKYTDTLIELILHKNIKSHGIMPEQITKVLLSHLHFDHVGGTVVRENGTLKLAFPRATYYVQKKEFQKAMEAPSKSYRLEILDALLNSGQLEFLDGDGYINEDIHYEITGGHTEFHQAFTIKDDHDIFFFGGDVLPDLYQLIRKFVAKYDFDGKKSAELRIAFGERSINQNSTLLFYHSIKVPFCKIVKTEIGFRVRE